MSQELGCVKKRETEGLEERANDEVGGNFKSKKNPRLIYPEGTMF